LRFSKRHILFLFFVFLAISCSVKKNTVISRTYHNLTALYNVYFNGNESYKKGIKRINNNLKDDYTSLLPVFPFPNSETSNSSFAEMERAIKKGSKTIILHSITAKPEMKKGIRTKREKEFYNKKEYNKWVDDAYLLIGKANLMKGDYQAATTAFRHILQEYPKENTYEETQIWLARALILKEEFMEAEDICKDMSGQKKLSRRLVPFLNATYADLHIHKKRFDDAIPKLEIAAKKARDKRSRIRYTYILGQLYQLTGHMDKATEKYLKVIKMNPPYEMTFNARVNLAGVFESGDKSADEIRKQLYKLLKDAKNKEYLDQIYFALGNLDFKEGNIDNALKNYKTSVFKSVSNQRQKARSYLAIADIKYTQKEYLDAQAYYDSAVTNIDATFPDYDKIYARAKSLKRLAISLNTVTFEDSVQFVAKMSENDRNKFIDQIIARVKEKEAEEQKRQQEELLEQQANMMSLNDLNSRGGLGQNVEGGKWYFYNPTSKGYGETEFQMKWGKRKLEDNWRRINKKSMSTTDITEEEQDKDNPDKVKKKTLSNKTREFYIQNLPLTDSLLAVSHNKIRKALYDAGIIYKDELSEYKLSSKEFEEIIKRYPEDPIAGNAAYQLYILYRQMENTLKAEEYKVLLLTKYPESIYAKLITNPNFIAELQEKENAVSKLYESAYDDYSIGNYASSYDKASQGIINYPNHKLIPKFIFVKALSNGKLTNIETLRTDLNFLIKEYPKSEEAGSAKDIITMMDVQHPEAKEAEEKVIAKEIYKQAADDEKHFFAIVVDSKKSNYNQLVFNIINFNLDNYSNSNLTVKTENLGTKNQMVVISAFNNKVEALNYYNTATKDNKVYKDIGNNALASFIISETNLATLRKDLSESTYMKFFKENYNQ